MSQRLESMSLWSWCLIFSMSLFLLGAQPFSSSPVWAAEKEAEEKTETAEEEESEGFEDLEELEEEPRKPRPKKKRLTREERAELAAAKAKAKAEKKRKQLRDKRIARIAGPFGKQKDGQFIVVLETTTFVVAQSKKHVPKLEYEVIVVEGRDAAAGKVLDFLLDIQRKIPVKPRPGSGPPPQGNYQLVARVDDYSEATDLKKTVQAKCAKLVANHNKQIRDNAGRGGGAIGLKGNPL